MTSLRAATLCVAVSFYLTHLCILPAVHSHNRPVIRIRPQLVPGKFPNLHHSNFQPINLYTIFYESKIITMPREYKNLIMTNFRRIAHSPREVECMARLLFMQVILVCVAEAAQKAWFAERIVRNDPQTDDTPGGSCSPFPNSPGNDGPDRSHPRHSAPCIVGMYRRLWGGAVYFPGRNCFPGGYQQRTPAS